MKIVVKGVMTVEDALASVRHGVDGIWVSNHGARQLDTVPATIEGESKTKTDADKDRRGLIDKDKAR